jgi:aminocarboxymuconate-semialdehyde decarboxylase
LGAAYFMQLIRCSFDCHTHFVPSSFPTYAGSLADAPWPEISMSGCGHGQVSISGKPFRKVRAAAWDRHRREKDATESGVDVQVVSPMPELLSYWLSPADGKAMCVFLNAEISRLVQDARDRFVGLGTVPLQDPQEACRVLEELMLDPSFAGVEIGTNINGVPIGDARFTEFFSMANRLGASVFVHALKPVGDERLTGPLALRAVVSFPCEVSFAICSAISGGMLSRHPGLRIAFSHGGGAFGSVLPRFSHAWKNIGAIRDIVSEDPSEIARRLFYDTLVYDRRTLKHLIGQFGATQFLVGSDYPFDIADPDPMGSVAEAASAREAALITHDNAVRFLGERSAGLVASSRKARLSMRAPDA